MPFARHNHPCRSTIDRLGGGRATPSICDGDDLQTGRGGPGSGAERPLLPSDPDRVGPWPAGAGLERSRLVIAVPADVDVNFEAAFRRTLARLRMTTADGVDPSPGGWTLAVPVAGRDDGGRAPGRAAHRLLAIDATTHPRSVARAVTEAREAAIRSTEGARP